MKEKDLTAETQRRGDAKDKRQELKIKKFVLIFNFRSSRSISKISASLRLCVVILLFTVFACAQKIAVVAPEKTGHSERFAAKLRDSLNAKFSVLDDSLSETAFHSSVNENDSFNLSTGAAKSIGAAIGCEFFLLVKSVNQRRSTFEKKDFYESFAVVYAVSARTGRLVFWKLQSLEAAKESEAEKLLFASINNLATEIFEKLKIVTMETGENTPRKIEEVPAENSPEAKNFRPPLPFKRIKPEYTRLAYIYDVKATIDVLVDVGADGTVMRTEIVRWAGFGLDESVTETVRKMNWRPAERNGKTLPMRVLLRYNFKRIEKEEF